jgi:predicted P-loop ATPase
LSTFFSLSQRLVMLPFNISISRHSSRLVLIFSVLISELQTLLKLNNTMKPTRAAGATWSSYARCEKLTAVDARVERARPQQKTPQCRHCIWHIEMALFPVLNVNRQHRQYVKKATVKSEGKKGSSPTPTIQRVVPTGASSGAA